MRKVLYGIMIFISALSVSVKMPAADLPSLPAASQIRTGALDNGIAYYIVTNNSEKGKANVALVQKSGYDYETLIRQAHLQCMRWEPCLPCLISSRILHSDSFRATVYGQVLADTSPFILTLRYIALKIWNLHAQKSLWIQPCCWCLT